jgi:7-carboxy-7-deazaguanine synthase
MKIAEIFYSIQGEGLLTGVPSVFIRTSGCNLRCWFCDTEYASWRPEGENLTVADILDRVAVFRAPHVVITGGEPLIAPELVGLCQALHQQGYHLTVETAGTVFQPVLCDLVSLSPKLASSTPHQREGSRFAAQHEQQRLNLEVLRAFLENYEYQLKFVIDRATDVPEMLALLDRVPGVDRSRVMLMPQGVTSEELRQRGQWLVEECKKLGLRYCPRVHIDLFGHRPGT